MKRLRHGAAAVVAAAALTGGLAGCGDDDAACDPGADLEIEPVVTGGTPLRSLGIARRGDVLIARVGTTGGMVPSLLVDVDDDRDTGMWSLQSPVSASGWDLLVDEKGDLHRHDGSPTEWSWERLRTDDGSGWTELDDGVLACVGAEAAAAAATPGEVVRVSALVGERSLPATFLPGAAWPEEPAGAAAPPEPVAPVEAVPVAFGYGYRPWQAGGCATVTCAVARYARFAHVVLGAGLEDGTHPSHAGSAELVAGLRAAAPATEVWGYVSLVGGPVVEGRRDRAHTTADIAGRAAAWKAMGATGIFLDEADLCRPGSQPCTSGPDGAEIGVDRAAQNAAVDAVHALGLSVFANGFAPADVIGEVGGVASTLGGGAAGRPPDVYLLENPTFAAGRRAGGVDADAGRARYLLAHRLTAAKGMRLAAVDTFEGAVADGYRGDPRWAEARAAAPAVTIHGITNEAYSATAELAGNLPLP